MTCCQKLDDVICLCRQLYCLVRHSLGNSQDRTLFRLHNCLIGSLSRTDKGVGQRLVICNLVCPLISFVKPRNSWDKITPEFPLAPRREPEEIAFARDSMVGFFTGLPPLWPRP